MKRSKTKKQRSKYGKRMKREMFKAINEDTETRVVEHPISLVMENGQGAAPVNVAFTARRGGGEAVSIGLCTDAGELIGAIHMATPEVVKLVAQLTDTVVGPGTAKECYAAANAMTSTTGATVH